MSKAKKSKMEAGPVSKTARASVGKGGKAAAFSASGEMNRIIPLAEGANCYLLDPRTGATHFLKVGSELFVDTMRELLESNHGPRIQAELDMLGWSVA